MVAMERPIMDHLVASPEAKGKWGFEARLKPVVSELVNLDYSGWRRQFKIDGFTETHVQTLDVLVEEWTGQIGVDALADRLSVVEDMTDDFALERVVGDWLECVAPGGISAIIARAEFPNVFGAVCYALGRLARIIDGAIEFEKTQREVRTEPGRRLVHDP